MRETISGRNPVYECLRAKRRDVFRLQIAEGVQERGRLAGRPLGGIEVEGHEALRLLPREDAGVV